MVLDDTLLRAARGERVDRIPVWLHRQAGRYLPEFRELRARHDFFELCQNPALACEVTLQPLRRWPLGLGAVIIFSDILVVPQALGLEVHMLKGTGPMLPEPLRDPENAVARLQPGRVRERCQHLFDAVRLTRLTLDHMPRSVPLVGFAGAPFTLFAYCIEGGGSKTLSVAKRWLYQHPEASHQLMGVIADAVVECLVGQARAGAQVLQLFDTWAGMVGPAQFTEFVLPYYQRIVQEVRQQLAAGDRDSSSLESVPITIFAKDAHYAIEQLVDCGFDVVSLDWTIERERVRQQTRGRVALQGNLDPCALYGSRESITRDVHQMINEFDGHAGGYIVNLGHGMYPDMSPEAVGYVIDAVHSSTPSSS